jgi:hypothetical protein
MISIDETRLVAAVAGMYILMQDVEDLGAINDRLQFRIHCTFSSCPLLIPPRKYQGSSSLIQAAPAYLPEVD